MKSLLGLFLICVGVWLVHTGWSQRASLVGKTQTVVARLGKAIDGEERVPEYRWYLVAGGVLGLAGGGLLFAGRKG